MSHFNKQMNYTGNRNFISFIGDFDSIQISKNLIKHFQKQLQTGFKVHWFDLFFFFVESACSIQKRIIKSKLKVTCLWYSWDSLWLIYCMPTKRPEQKVQNLPSLFHRKTFFFYPKERIDRYIRLLEIEKNPTVWKDSVMDNLILDNPPQVISLFFFWGVSK